MAFSSDISRVCKCRQGDEAEELAKEIIQTSEEAQAGRLPTEHLPYLRAVWEQVRAWSPSKRPLSTGSLSDVVFSRRWILTAMGSWSGTRCTRC